MYSSFQLSQDQSRQSDWIGRDFIPLVDHWIISHWINNDNNIHLIISPCFKSIPCKILFIQKTKPETEQQQQQNIYFTDAQTLGKLCSLWHHSFWRSHHCRIRKSERRPRFRITQRIRFWRRKNPARIRCYMLLRWNYDHRKFYRSKNFVIRIFRFIRFFGFIRIVRILWIVASKLRVTWDGTMMNNYFILIWYSFFLLLNYGEKYSNFKIRLYLKVLTT